MRNFKVRRLLIILPLVLPFFMYMLSLAVKDLSADKNDYKVDASTIKDIFQGTYEEKQSRDCLDIYLIDKPYFIRFNRSSDKEFWQTIDNGKSLNKSIAYTYLPHLLHDGILYNPNRIVIDNVEIIPFNDQSFMLWCAVALISTFILLFAYFFIRAIIIYRRELYDMDKEIRKESIWKLVRVWLTQ
jgi:hypothetical protein